MITQTLQLSGLHCVGCSLHIEGELEDLGAAARVNYVKQTVTITYDEKYVAIAAIRKRIEKLGYKVVS